MSKKSRLRAADGAPRFVLLHHWLLKSPAWLALSPNGKAVLLHVWARHNGSNNGQIVYGVRDADEIGLTKDQASRALIELVAIGFLRVVRNSAFPLNTNPARTCRLTAAPAAGEAATKDFMRWLPAAPQSHQRDREAAGKSKTRSHQRDTQYHQRDRNPESGAQNGVTVAPARPSEAISTHPQSHQRDTSIMPCGAQPPPAVAGRPIPKFGDAAFAARTARHRDDERPHLLSEWDRWIADELDARREAETTGAPAVQDATDGLAVEMHIIAAAIAAERLVDGVGTVAPQPVIPPDTPAAKRQVAGRAKRPATKGRATNQRPSSPIFNPAARLVWRVPRKKTPRSSG